MNLALFKTWTDAKRFDPAKEYLDKTSHVRVYPYSPGVVSVQIRSEGKTTEMGGGKAWYVNSNAHLDLESAKTLHAALEIWIVEQGGP